MDEKTKGERREERRRNQRKMRVSGKSNQLLWQLIVQKAEKVRQAREREAARGGAKGAARPKA
ncbi:MAG: hypothetical protein ACYC4L_06715 [Chloroflexota bacterium]